MTLRIPSLIHVAICVYALAFCCLFIQKVGAEEKNQKPDFSELASNPLTVTVQKVIDPISFLASDGNIYRLTGLDVPGLTSFPESPVALETKTYLEKAIAGQTLYLYQSRDLEARQNRMGHFPVHAVRKFDNAWIQGDILSAGLARALTTPTAHEMSAAMLALEQKARNDKKGLWADAIFKIITPEEALTIRNDIYIIEGIVKSAAINKNIIYLNFGDDWKKDFTIVVPSELRQKLSRSNINLLSFKDKKIRIRGYVESYNGPTITLTHFAQMEALEAPAPQAPSTAVSHQAPD